MSNGLTSARLRDVLVLVAIVEGLNGLGAIFFQPTLAAVYGSEILDPEMTKVLGVAFLAITYLIIMGLKSGSREVITPIVKALILFAALLVLVMLWGFFTTHVYNLQTYLMAGIMHLIILVLLVWALVVK